MIKNCLAPFCRLGLLGLVAFAIPLAAAMDGPAHYDQHHRHNTVNHNGLQIENLRVRAIPSVLHVTAGFFKITNTGTDDDRLVSVSAEFAEKAEIHTMAVENNVMRMRPLAEGIIIPAGESVVFMPGGLHLMFMRLNEHPAEGESKKITLVFEKAGAVVLMADVKKIRHHH